MALVGEELHIAEDPDFGNVQPHQVAQWWQSRNTEHAEKQWNSWDAPHRATLAKVPELLKLKSLFEIGCGSGPNLRLLQDAAPDLILGGSDISPQHVIFTREHLGIECHEMALPHGVGNGWEATLSCFSLAYLQEEIVQVILENIHSKYLILIEPWGHPNRHSDKVLPKKNSPDVPPRWNHNWWMLTDATGWTLDYRWPIYPLDHLSTLAIFTKPSERFHLTLE